MYESVAMWCEGCDWLGVAGLAREGEVCQLSVTTDLSAGVLAPPLANPHIYWPHKLLREH